MILIIMQHGTAGSADVCVDQTYLHRHQLLCYHPISVFELVLSKYNQTIHSMKPLRVFCHSHVITDSSFRACASNQAPEALDRNNCHRLST